MCKYLVEFLQVCLGAIIQCLIYKAAALFPMKSYTADARFSVLCFILQYTLASQILIEKRCNYGTLKLTFLQSDFLCFLLFLSMHNFPVAKFVNVFAFLEYLCVATFKIKKIFSYKFPLLWKTISIKLKFSTETNTTQHYLGV